MNNSTKMEIASGLIKASLNKMEAMIAAGKVGQKSLQGMFSKMPKPFAPSDFMAREYQTTTQFMPAISKRISELHSQPGKGSQTAAFLLSRDLSAPVRRVRSWLRNGINN